MKIHAWRIFKPKHAATAFSGEGGRLYGGRWNSKGTAIIYTAHTLSLAALEMLVHLQTRHVLDTYLVVRVTFDSSLVKEINRVKLSKNWRTYPPPRKLQQLGDQWVRDQESVVLCVPSVLIVSENNYLLNPAHPDFGKIILGKPEPFEFDPRLAN